MHYKTGMQNFHLFYNLCKKSIWCEFLTLKMGSLSSPCGCSICLLVTTYLAQTGRQKERDLVLRHSLSFYCNFTSILRWTYWLEEVNTQCVAYLRSFWELSFGSFLYMTRKPWSPNSGKPSNVQMSKGPGPLKSFVSHYTESSYCDKRVNTLVMFKRLISCELHCQPIPFLLVLSSVPPGLTSLKFSEWCLWLPPFIL